MVLRDQIAEAEGRSEFVIAVVADVRGFSAFSRRHESTDIAMFIKRFYMRLMDDYFSEANFYKTKGDGLLMTFPYSEKDLQEISDYVISNCFQCLIDFPGICAGDPMINFKTPENIGFGIARGTACCLYSGEEVIDYLGHLLNLSSRLMDLARPSGIIIDGNYLHEIIADDFKNSFIEKEIYIRGISEDRPYKVFYLEDYVNIPEEATTPLTEVQWHTIHKRFKMQEIAEIKNLSILLPTYIKKGSEIKITMIFPKMRKGRMVKGYRTHRIFNDFEYRQKTDEPKVTLDLRKAYKYLRSIRVQKTKFVQFKIQFVPDRVIAS